MKNDEIDIDAGANEDSGDLAGQISDLRYRLDAGVLLIIGHLLEIKDRFDAGVAAPGTRTLSEIGTKVRRVIEQHADQPDRSMGARWFSRLLGIPAEAIAKELELMVLDGLLYSRPFYKGKLYYRCGHGPAARARRGNGAPAKAVKEMFDLVEKIVKAGEYTSQAAVETVVKSKTANYRRQDFWQVWADLKYARALHKNEHGMYVLGPSAGGER
jgi:hypothetical protein